MRIRKVDANTQVITTVAGGKEWQPHSTYSGEGGPATEAIFYGVDYSYVVVDPQGNIIFSAAFSEPSYGYNNNNRVLMVNAATGIISTIAGNGLEGFSGDGGPATNASLRVPTGLALDAQGNLYILDTENHRVRKVEANTPLGSNVSVLENGGTVTFSQVNAGGITTVALAPDAPSPPSNFQVSGSYYSISTTASISGPITITLPYDPSTVYDPSAVRLYHYSGGQWVDVTTSVDVNLHTVTGVVTSLSIFAPGTPYYNFLGFLPPIRQDGGSIFKLGSTVPVKFQLTDIFGQIVTNAIAEIFIAKVTDNILGVELQAVSTTDPDSGNLFRFDSVDNQYIFNLSTKGLSEGTWQIRVRINDGSSHTVFISLK